MRYKTLVRVAVKVLGIYLMAEGVAAGIHAVVFSLSTIGSPAGRVWSAWDMVSMLSSPICYLGVGCYLFLGGTWVVNKIIPSNRPYCPECGYELTGLVRNRCPECGTPLSEDLVASSRSAGSADGAC